METQIYEQVQVKQCPIETTLGYIGKKWSIAVIRDMFYGKKHFNEFISSNPELSGKVLSQRLKELEKAGIIQKKVASTTPVNIEYSLTAKGRSLNKVIYELAMFSLNTCPSEVLAKKSSIEKAEQEFRQKLFVGK